MRFVFLSNYINHHQIPLCERLYELMGDGFSFLQSMPVEEERKGMGWKADASFPWLKKLYENEDLCVKLLDEADAAFLGWSERPDLDRRRLSSKKTTLRMSEPVYKDGRYKFISPRGLYHKYQEHIRYRKDPVPMLCAGAYAAYDFTLMRAYPGKLFKWGYFPPFRPCMDPAGSVKGTVPDPTGSTDTSEISEDPFIKNRDGRLSLVWAGRFIDWKHPDFPIRAASALKRKGVSFTLYMIGGGPLEDRLKALTAELSLTSCVEFTGYRTPDETRDIMDKCFVLLMTSDLREGWGAVVNEGMNSGCCPVASWEAGSVPYLVKDRDNGRIYRRGSYEDFERALMDVVSDPDHMHRMGERAYETIRDSWNGRIAADRLFEFTRSLLAGEMVPREEGILSRAEVIRPE
ncbi:MAG: glycosyltransferase [Lachnospiraceae bacterium]|nr:glycosyltransferase [Lachnospiraceae bacterium]